MKMACQGPVSSRICPMLGARTGMAMNTMKTSDMTSAISRPEYRSRTTAVVMTRTLAAPRPCTKRRTSSMVKLGAKAAVITATI